MSGNAEMPAALGFGFPAEWEPHARTWMAWPTRPATWRGGIEGARAAHLEVAQAIAGFEPVTMVCSPADVAEVSLQCGPGIDVLPIPLSDGWMRDIGPTFLRGPAGEIAGVDWIFNGWGGLHDDWAVDAKVAEEVLRTKEYRRFAAPIVCEGGALGSDGQGTVLVTEECLFQRNPGMTKAEIEAVLCDCLGAAKVIWLGKGYEGDETRGHIDEVACFVAPGRVLIQMPTDPEDPNYLIQHDNLARLKLATDARGRSLEVVAIPQPARRDKNGERLTLSYVNFAFVNGGLIVPSFGDPCDDAAFKTLSVLYPERKIVQILADDIVAGGGGIHCITQQEPA